MVSQIKMPFSMYSRCLFMSAITSLIFEAMTDCSCNQMHFCDCSSQNLNFIPSNLPRDINGLDLSNNKIHAVTGSDLRGYEKLEMLYLTQNEINFISDDSFQSISKLKELDLSNNNLSSLSPAWFQNLQMLKHLNLLGNSYPSLGTSSLFSGLSSLDSLRLGNPYFRVLQKQDLQGLERLDEFQLNVPNLQEYAVGSLEGIKDINHMILTVQNSSSIPHVLEDLEYSVTLLEIRNVTYLSTDRLIGFDILNYTSVRKLMFKNCTFTDESFGRLCEIVQYYNNVTHLILEDCELQGTGQGSPTLKDKMNSITTIIIHNLYIPNFYLFSDLQFLYQIAKNINSVTVTESKLFLMPCHFSRSFLSLEYLDVSGNLLKDMYLAGSSCFFEGGGAWPLIKTFNVSKNLLTQLPDVASMLSEQKHLINLDLSQNKFSDSSLSTCQWAPTLQFLNLSSCQIKNIGDCIPVTLETLDVSNNYLSTFVAKLQNLTVLYISNNWLAKLPCDAHLPNLGLLFIKTNKLNGFYKSELDHFSKLTSLDGSDNNYECSCEFLDYIKSNKEILLGWPDRYICDSPSAVRNERIQDAQLSIVKCHKTVFVIVSCIILIVLIVIMAALCHFLHVIWYLKMTWAWLKAKRKPADASDRDICYNAFVSYSEMDSEWVENMMTQELENTHPPLKLCLHKRDFVPGKWIIDNIIEAMEKSYKTLFILSEHFVKSEWCKYELEFSHFRLFEENNDTAILILLEPMEKESMPKRFYKLRKLMSTRTYMEWPTDEEEQHNFWHNLKSTLQVECTSA
uniref:Toll-like receptor 2 n=1 Tax=Leptobrachium leishanense TaxID=445787 RepID=A0A8C5QB97_9ANUR